MHAKCILNILYYYIQMDDLMAFSIGATHAYAHTRISVTSVWNFKRILCFARNVYTYLLQYEKTCMTARSFFFWPDIVLIAQFYFSLYPFRLLSVVPFVYSFSGMR